jgi:phosphoribosylglycinamide formyltransferase 1
MRFGVLVSGSGTNLQALLDARARGELAPGEIAVVISNRPGALALERARKAEIPAEAIDHRRFGKDRAAFERELLTALDRHAVEAVILAGFMRVLTADFVARYPRRILNTHPSLLPAFPGIRAPEQALAHGVKVSGCTIHFVDAGVDTGPIIFQAAVGIEDADDAAALHARIQAEEHRLLPKAAQLLAAGALVCEDRRVRVAQP